MIDYNQSIIWHERGTWCFRKVLLMMKMMMMMMMKMMIMMMMMKKIFTYLSSS